MSLFVNKRRRISARHLKTDDYVLLHLDELPLDVLTWIAELHPVVWARVARVCTNWARFMILDKGPELTNFAFKRRKFMERWFRFVRTGDMLLFEWKHRAIHQPLKPYCLSCSVPSGTIPNLRVTYNADGSLFGLTLAIAMLTSSGSFVWTDYFYVWFRASAGLLMMNLDAREQLSPYLHSVLAPHIEKYLPELKDYTFVF